MNAVNGATARATARARTRARARARARAGPYYFLHSQSVQQFINCCADYDFTNCSAGFINCANS